MLWRIVNWSMVFYLVECMLDLLQFEWGLENCTRNLKTMLEEVELQILIFQNNINVDLWIMNTPKFSSTIFWWWCWELGGLGGVLQIWDNTHESNNFDRCCTAVAIKLWSINFCFIQDPFSGEKLLVVNRMAPILSEIKSHN